MGQFDIDRVERPEPSRKIKDKKVNDLLKKAQKELSVWESKVQALESQGEALQDACDEAFAAIADALRDRHKMDDDHAGELDDMQTRVRELRDKIRRIFR